VLARQTAWIRKAWYDAFGDVSGYSINRKDLPMIGLAFAVQVLGIAMIMLPAILRRPVAMPVGGTITFILGCMIFGRRCSSEVPQGVARKGSIGGFFGFIFLVLAVRLLIDKPASSLIVAGICGAFVLWEARLVLHLLPGNQPVDS
jgi:hypothetical protein